MKRRIINILAFLVLNVFLVGCYESKYPLLDIGMPMPIEANYTCLETSTVSLKQIVKGNNYTYLDADSGDRYKGLQVSKNFFLVQISSGRPQRHQLAYFQFQSDGTVHILVPNLGEASSKRIKALAKKFGVDIDTEFKSQIEFVGVNVPSKKAKLLQFLKAHDQYMLMLLETCEPVRKKTG